MLRKGRQGKPVCGFTLIELAVLLAIISVIIVNFVVTREGTQKLGGQIQTTQQMRKVRTALAHYYTQYKYYPCPADPSVISTDADFGVAKDLGLGTCATSANRFTNPAHNVVMGAVPVRTLGLAPEDMIDAQGNRLFYAVDKRLTMDTSTLCSQPISDIKLLSDYNTGQSRTYNITPSNGLYYANPPYILMSMGPDSVGAYPYYGTANPVARNMAEPFTAGDNTPNYWEKLDSGITKDNTKATDIDEKWTPTNLTDIFIAPRTPVASTVHFDNIITSPMDDTGVFTITTPTTTASTPPVANYDFWLNGGDSSTMFTDSACSTQVANDGDKVACWKDSGQGSAGVAHHWDATNTSGVAASVPIFKKDRFGPCKHSVQFATTSESANAQYLISPTALQNYSYNQAMTLFVVVHGQDPTPVPPDDRCDYHTILGAMNFPTDPFWDLLAQCSHYVAQPPSTMYKGDWWLYDNNSTPYSTNPDAKVSTPPDPALDNKEFPTEYTLLMDTAAATDYVEGRQGNTGTRTPNASTYPGKLTVGAGYHTPPTEGFTGDISEILLYKKALLPSEQKDTECYLMQKWGTSPFYTDGYWSTTGSPNAKKMLWLKAFCPYQYTLSGSSVTSWNDLSRLGNNATASEGNQAPTMDTSAFGSKGAMVFDGTKAQALSSSAPQLSSLSASRASGKCISVGTMVEVADGEGGYIVGRSSDGAATSGSWEIRLNPYTGGSATNSLVLSVDGYDHTLTMPIISGNKLALQIQLCDDALGTSGSKVSELFRSNSTTPVKDDVDWGVVPVTANSNPVTIGRAVGTTGTVAADATANKVPASDITDATDYTGWYLTFTSGAVSTTAPLRNYTVTGYDGTAKEFTVLPALTAIPAIGDKFVLTRNKPFNGKIAEVIVYNDRTTVAPGSNPTPSPGFINIVCGLMQYYGVSHTGTGCDYDPVNGWLQWP